MTATATMPSRLSTINMKKGEDYRQVFEQKLKAFTNFLGNAKDCLKTKLKYCAGRFQKSFSKQTPGHTHATPAFEHERG